MEAKAGATLTNRMHRFASAAEVTLDASKTVGTFDVSALETVYVRLTVATAALTALAFQMRANANDAYLAISDAAGDFTTPIFPVLNKTSDLTTAAAGSYWVWLDVRGIDSLRVVANSGGTATLALEVGGN